MNIFAIPIVSSCGMDTFSQIVSAFTVSQSLKQIVTSTTRAQTDRDGDTGNRLTFFSLKSQKNSRTLVLFQGYHPSTDGTLLSSLRWCNLYVMQISKSSILEFNLGNGYQMSFACYSRLKSKFYFFISSIHLRQQPFVSVHAL